MTPIVTLSIGGAVLGQVAKRALSGEIVESDGEKADELRMIVSNFDGRLRKPRREEKITVKFGWKETGVVKVGEYIVAETVKTGPRAEFHITAHSADLKKSLKGQKSRSWTKGKTLGDVYGDLAKDNQLSLAMDSELKQIKIDKIVAQTAESDMHLGTRLARHFGALFKVADGRMMVVKKGKGQTASGQAAARCVLTPNDCEGFTFTDRDRPARDKAKAVHYDRDKAKRSEEASEGGLAAGGSPDYVSPWVYGTQEEAKKFAVARKGKFDRDGRSFNATLMAGRTGVAPGGVAQTQGFGDDDDREWVVTKRTFGWGPEGNVVRIASEPKEEG